MLFHEIYGCYYRAVAKALSCAVKGELTPERLRKIIDETAFSESFLAIIPALQEQSWQLIDGAYHTPLKHEPTLPMTMLEKRWMKAISLDPRFRLFGITLPEFVDVEPLFTEEDYCAFDQYADGDPYTDETYICHFQTILRALREKHRLRVRYVSGAGEARDVVCTPKALEYSEKDDKFRLLTSGRNHRSINLQRMHECECTDEPEHFPLQARRLQKRQIVFLLKDERSALERAMMHFAHFEKEAEKLDAQEYRVTLHYSSEDENELLIRILSFGPLIRVIEPKSFITQIQHKLQEQKRCGLF